MSEKLRTLNDFIELWKNRTTHYGDIGFDDIEELKAEAIKWVKSDKIKHMNGTDILLVFFNLTEEDL